MLQLQQGDVLLRQTGHLPEGAQPVEGLVLAHGESGHTHRVMEIERARLLDLKGELYMEITGASVTLIHDEHRAITVPPGIYQVGRVREMDWLSERVRSLAD